MLHGDNSQRRIRQVRDERLRGGSRNELVIAEAEIDDGETPSQKLNRTTVQRDAPVQRRPAQPSLETVRSWLGELEHAIARGERGVLDWVLRTDADAARKRAV